tara:strand:+ start:254 stop:472 length:219 start_codon:yes stop_codon:yes gene_type:complete
MRWNGEISEVNSSMMRSLTPLIKRLWKSDSGVTAIEYALIAALIAIVIVASLTLVGTDLGTMLDNFSKNLAT